MSSIPIHTSYDTWTVEELIDATSTNPHGNKKVTIPEFQRRLVWPRKKQEGLIHSIKNGYPFGSLLVYRDTDSVGIVENYKLIDGLQRTQTLRQYTDHPNSTFSKSDLSDDFIDLVAREIDIYSDLDCLASRNQEKIRRRILEWVWDSRGFTEDAGWGINALTDVLLLEMLDLDDETYEFYMARKSLLTSDSAYRVGLDRFLSSIQTTSDISKVEVPIIIYSGPSVELADVFVLLNTQGIQLHRYEVYAAQWLDFRYRVRNTEIIDAIWRKYGELEKAGFNLDVYAEASDAKSRIERAYTLFEYLFGLGQHLTQHYPHFFKPVKVDQPSPFGFNLMSACIVGSVAEKDVRILPDNVRGLDISRLEEYLLESIHFVHCLLKPVLSAQRYGQSKIPYFHADLQIVCMIATVFRVRYNSKDLTEIEGWTAKRDKLAQHLPMYYLYEVLNENWRGSGDSRLAEILSNESYMKQPPSEEIWTQVLNVWLSNNLNDRRHEKIYIKDSWSEYLLLRYIFVQKLKASQLFHVHHLMPVTRLISPPSDYYKSSGPINTIGNLSLVAETEHTDMGDLSFVEYLNRRKTIGKLSPLRYDPELQRYERLLLCKSDELPSELTEHFFESFLRRRIEVLKRKFFNVWRDHIPPN